MSVLIESNLVSELFSEMKKKLVSSSGAAIQAIFEAGGGAKAIELADNGRTMWVHLPEAYRSNLYDFYLNDWITSVHRCTVVEKIFLSSPTQKRPIPVLVEGALSENEPEALDHSIVTARSRVLLQRSRKQVAIVDRNGLHLDANFVKRRIGYDRSDVLGRTVFEVMPHLADVAQQNLSDAFGNPEVPFYREFTTDVLGLPTRFRSRIIALGDEAIVWVKPLDNYHWLY